MENFLDTIKNLFVLITDFVLKALFFWWNTIIEAEQKAAAFMLERLAEILPESGVALSSSIIDFFECLNYYFPVKETFVILAIYLQFRIALLIVRSTVKIMTAGQF